MFNLVNRTKYTQALLNLKARGDAPSEQNVYTEYVKLGGLVLEGETAKKEEVVGTQVITSKNHVKKGKKAV